MKKCFTRLLLAGLLEFGLVTTGQGYLEPQDVELELIYNVVSYRYADIFALLEDWPIESLMNLSFSILYFSYDSVVNPHLLEFRALHPFYIQMYFLLNIYPELYSAHHLFAFGE